MWIEPCSNHSIVCGNQHRSDQRARDQPPPPLVEPPSNCSIEDRPSNMDMETIKHLKKLERHEQVATSPTCFLSPRYFDQWLQAIDQNKKNVHLIDIDAMRCNYGETLSDEEERKLVNVLQHWRTVRLVACDFLQIAPKLTNVVELRIPLIGNDRVQRLHLLGGYLQQVARLECLYIRNFRASYLSDLFLMLSLGQVKRLHLHCSETNTALQEVDSPLYAWPTCIQHLSLDMPKNLFDAIVPIMADAIKCEEGNYKLDRLVVHRSFSSTAIARLAPRTLVVGNVDMISSLPDTALSSTLQGLELCLHRLMIASRPDQANLARYVERHTGELLSKVCFLVADEEREPCSWSFLRQRMDADILLAVDYYIMKRKVLARNNWRKGEQVWDTILLSSTSPWSDCEYGASPDLKSHQETVITSVCFDVFTERPEFFQQVLEGRALMSCNKSNVPVSLAI